MTWQDSVPNCFGKRDYVFAEHEEEREAAIAMINNAARYTSRGEVRAHIAHFLKDKSCLPPHINEQLKRFDAILKEEATREATNLWKERTNYRIRESLVAVFFAATVFVVSLSGFLLGTLDTLLGTVAAASGFALAFVIGTLIPSQDKENAARNLIMKALNGRLLWGAARPQNTAIVLALEVGLGTLAWVFGYGSTHQFYFQCIEKQSLVWVSAYNGANSLKCADPEGRVARIWNPLGRASITEGFSCRDEHGPLGRPVPAGGDREWRCKTRREVADGGVRDAGSSSVDASVLDVGTHDVIPVDVARLGFNTCPAPWIQWQLHVGLETVHLNICTDPSSPTYQLFRYHHAGQPNAADIREDASYSRQAWDRGMLIRYPDGGPLPCNPYTMSSQQLTILPYDQARCDAMILSIREHRPSMAGPAPFVGLFTSPSH